EGLVVTGSYPAGEGGFLRLADEWVLANLAEVEIEGPLVGASSAATSSADLQRSHRRPRVRESGSVPEHLGGWYPRLRSTRKGDARWSSRPGAAGARGGTCFHWISWQVPPPGGFATFGRDDRRVTRTCRAVRAAACPSSRCSSPSSPSRTRRLPSRPRGDRCRSASRRRMPGAPRHRWWGR